MPPIEEIMAMPAGTLDEWRRRQYLLDLKALDNDVITSRNDLVYESESGIWIMDYKTVGRSKTNSRTGRLIRWNEANEFALNWQSLINLHILRAKLGPRVRGFVVTRATRQPPYDFDRNPLTIPSIAYMEAPRAAREAVLHEYEVMRKIEQGSKPRPSYHACWGRYGACDYRDVCRAHTEEERAKILTGPSYTQMPAAEIQAFKSRLRVVQ
jgi:hypothetical protein